MKLFFSKIHRFPSYLFISSGYEIFEAFQGIVLFLFGLAILNPVVHSFSEGSSFYYISLVMTETTFGVILLIISVFAFNALLMGTYEPRILAAGAISFVWAGLAIALFVGNTSAVMPWIFTAFFFFSITTFARLVRDNHTHVPPWILR